MYFDPNPAIIDPTSFTGSTSKEFSDQYRGAKEELTNYALKPRGGLVQATAFVDESHVTDKKTRQSHTGYSIFTNHAPIIWDSK